MQANRLLKGNIDALLRARQQTRHDLAVWCRRTDAWLSKILSENPTVQARGLPLKYLDRIADFFGIATYQLFQPGITPLLERRKGDRRGGTDRRVSAMHRRMYDSLGEAVANLSPADIADIVRWKALSEESRVALRDGMQAAARSELQAVKQGKGRRAAGTATAPPMPRAAHDAPGQGKKRKG